MKYALLLARQRSGTGAVGTVLDKHPEVKYLGEVFHPDNLGQNHNYFTFLRERAGTDPDAVLPENRYGLFLAFLEDMAGQYPDRTLVVDIKYNSLHHLNGGWQGLVAQPRVLAQAKEQKRPILHLTRRNTLQSFVSGRLAEANKVWHARPGNEIGVTSTVINIRQLSNFIVTMQREMDLVERWTRNYPHLEKFDYADAFDADGLLDAALADRLASLFGVAPFSDRAPVFVKQAPARMEDAVENYDLVRQALVGTDHKWMLD